MSIKQPIEYSVYQKAIFREIQLGDSNFIVVARAGASKTTTIVQGAKYIPKGKKALFVAFNKSIQLTLREKLPSYTECFTLHSLGFTTLKSRFPNAALDENKAWNIVTELVGDTKDNIDLRDSLCKTVSLCKARLVDVPAQIDELMTEFDIDTCEEEPDKFIQYVCQALRQCKERTETVDFNDMVWYPFIYRMKPKQYDIVFIDECGDLSKAQIELAISAAKPNGRIIAVGDNFQILYQFAGVEINTFDYIRQRLNNPKELPLPICYRCPSSVVKLAQKYVPDIQVWDKAKEGKIEYLHTDELVKRVVPGAFILSRYNAPLIGIAFQLLKAGIRCNIRGRDIGRGLKSLIKKSKKKTVPKFIEWLNKWEKAERSRLLAKNPRAKVEYVQDKAECLYSLCENCLTLEEVEENIDSLFKDETKKEEQTKADKQLVWISSIHRVKGDQADVVFILSDTLSEVSQAEINLCYVAATRSCRELYYVQRNIA